jgi:FixJ family two-component response regulator
MRPTALLVDDDATVLIALPDTLQCRLPRLRVETTSSVVDALARLEVKAYSVILTDLRMPRLDGLGLMREVKRRHVDTPVVLMTGTTDSALLKQALETGIFDILPKPLDRDDLSTTIQLALRTHSLLREIKASQERLRRHVVRLARLQTKGPLERHSELKDLSLDLFRDAALVRKRASGSLADSDARMQRNRQRLQETEKLLRSVREVARQRSQARVALRELYS